MRHMQDSYRGLSMFFGLNIDRLLSAFMILAAIFCATWIQAL